MSDRYVIEVDGLKKYFPLRDGLFGQQTGELRAVDGSALISVRALFLAWWASPAAAKPPSAEPCLACTRRAPAA